MTHDWGVGQYFMVGLLSLIAASIIGWFMLSIGSVLVFGRPKRGDRWKHETKTVGEPPHREYLLEDQRLPTWRYRGEKYIEFILNTLLVVGVVGGIGYTIYLIGRLVVALF